MDTFIIPNQNIIDHFINVEGYKTNAYKDSLGYWTIGIGHLLSLNQYKDLSYISWTHDQILNQFYIDYNQALTTAKRIYTNFDNMTDKQQLAVTDLSFNLGYNKLKLFHTTNKLINAGMYIEAANNLSNTLWAKQVGRRLKIIQDLLMNA